MIDIGDSVDALIWTHGSHRDCKWLHVFLCNRNMQVHMKNASTIAIPDLQLSLTSQIMHVTTVCGRQPSTQDQRRAKFCHK